MQKEYKKAKLGLNTNFERFEMYQNEHNQTHNTELPWQNRVIIKPKSSHGFH